MSATERAGFEAFVQANGPALFRSAYMLVGSRSEAEDLLQEALERIYRHWARTSIGHPVAYVRRTMANLAASRWRRRRLVTVELTSDHETAVADETDNVHQRTALLGALACLPPRQRVVVVLRYWEDMTERETARSVGCSVGSVKRHASRGLARLRQVMGPIEAPRLPPIPTATTTTDTRRS